MNWAAPRPGRRVLALFATLLALAGVLVLSDADAVRRIESQLLDGRFHLRSAVPVAESPVVAVLIDDRSIEALGRWPWDRARLAVLVDRIAEAGASVIALDLLFTEPQDEPRLRLLRDEVERLRALAASRPRTEPVLRRAIEGLAERMRDQGGDHALAASIAAAGRVVVPYYFAFDEVDDASPPPPAVARTAYPVVGPTGVAVVALDAAVVQAPVSPIAEAAHALGHVNIVVDAAGSARFAYPLIAHHGALYPAFALEIARLAMGLDRSDVEIVAGEGVRLGERMMRSDESLRWLLDFSRDLPAAGISALDLLDDEIDPARLAGRVVIVGGDAAGLRDRVVTPFDPAMPGVALHATIVANLLGDGLLQRRDAHALIDLAIVAFGGLVLGALGGRGGIAGTAAALVVLVAAAIAINIWAFVAHGLWLHLAAPLGGLLFVGLCLIAHDHAATQRRQRRIRGAFAHYLHPDMVERLVREPELLRLGGEAKQLSVLFADLRGFTALSARLPPETLVAFLNDHFAALTRVILAERGMLDKYVGDGLIAVFGAPLPEPDHALRACRAALAMQAEMAALAPHWQERIGAPVVLGIGINTGRMVLGNVGTEGRFDYTVIGEEVNLASRLEAATKTLAVPIVISAATREAAGGAIVAEALGEIALPGLERPVAAFRLDARADAQTQPPSAT